MYQANEQLRRAREQLPSRQTPGECLSRQEVAELVNAWIFAETQTRVELDANYVGKLERGVIRWPSRLYRQALRVVLRAETDVQLGFYTQRRRSTSVTDVDRQQFLRLAGSAMALPWLDLFTPIEATPIPNKVGRTEIEQVCAATAAFRSLAGKYGGGVARDAVFAQLRWSGQLLHADCPERLRPDLFGAVALLGGVAGYVAFDAYAHDDARRGFRFGLACADQSGDWHLRAGVLADMARQAIWCGRPDEGLTFTETALVRADRLTATERASLQSLRARALAKLRRVQDALSAVGAADEAFAHAKPAEDPPWMAFYDNAEHRGNTGHALFDLSIAGRNTNAAGHLAYSAAHYGTGYVRARAIKWTKLASLQMVTGDPRNAAAIGHKAIAAAGNLRSARVVDNLSELHSFAGRHPNITEAKELRDRITETLAAT